MDLDRLKEVVSGNESTLRSKFHVASLTVFGSVARGESQEASDIDFVVEFDGEYSYAQLLDLVEFLERLLDAPVDLLTKGSLTPRLRNKVEAEGLRVA
ncbi:MAG TPA: nucleotidyltransferase family protein [Fimbriimonadaceae bacterium]|nr:nucleotidyltransferase family protein [Fimbriimonadaceae bacterium]